MLHRDWTGYADQKNYAAEAASHDWILSLDADEVLSEGLREEILRVRSSSPEVAAFRFPAAGPLPGEVDQSFRLVSGSQDSALRPPEGKVGGRLHS